MIEKNRYPLNSYRIRDLLLASTLLILFSPLFLLICLGLYLSQGRVFFVQTRPGLDEKPFRLIKFSTLYDAAPGQDEAANQRARLTPLGKYLRRLSLDELPQLLNVLKGDMSLVGPRPLLMEYLQLYAPEERARHQVLPGITGLAQVNGRNALSFKQRFQYDLWYVQHKSHWLDIKILLKTLLNLLRPTGVYANAHTTSPKFDGTN
ncbi:MAG: sugar transferase [Bacteroidetes bacterium]|nr:MAG: sugar transferase [Bacteroidota bacterium]